MKNLVKRLYVRLLGDGKWRLPKMHESVCTGVELAKITGDIRKVTQAAGPLRVIQVSSFLLMRQIADLLVQNQIRYSLCGGTLLGAIRHQGFIPWDDDIDMAVLQDDYEAVYRVLVQYFTPERGFDVIKSNCIRVIMKGAPCQVDVFPFEIHRVEDDGPAGRKAFSRKRDELLARIQIDWSRLESDGRVVLNEDVIPGVMTELAQNDAGEKKILATGCCARNMNYPPIKYDWVFPLGTARFEGYSFSVPAKPKTVLVNYFGDYMRFPRVMRPHEDIRNRLSVESYEKMIAFIRVQVSPAEVVRLLGEDPE